MKRILLLALLLLALQCPIRAPYAAASPDSAAACDDERPGCQVLQTVMLGSFADFDPTDSLNVRVFSAALPRLTAVTEADFSHFTTHCDVEPRTLRASYHIALGNCLRADIMVNPIVDDIDAQNARTVLMLFLDPSGEDAEEQMQLIRENSTAETFRMLAENASVSVEFVEQLISASGGELP